MQLFQHLALLGGLGQREPRFDDALLSVRQLLRQCQRLAVHRQHESPMRGDEAQVQYPHQVIGAHVVVGLLHRFVELADLRLAIGFQLEALRQGAHFFLFDMHALSKDTSKFEDEFRHGLSGRRDGLWLSLGLGLFRSTRSAGGLGFDLQLGALDQRVQLKQCFLCLFQIAGRGWLLLEKLDDAWPHLHGKIKVRIHARHIRADVHQIFDLTENRQQRQHPPRGRELILLTNIAAHAADALNYIDRGKMTTIRQGTIEPQVPIRDSFHRIGNRLVEIIALNQHGIETRDRTDRRVAALQNLWNRAAKLTLERKSPCGQVAPLPPIRFAAAPAPCG